jgi:hypothetical protein
MVLPPLEPSGSSKKETEAHRFRLLSMYILSGAETGLRCRLQRDQISCGLTFTIGLALKAEDEL